MRKGYFVLTFLLFVFSYTKAALCSISRLSDTVVLPITSMHSYPIPVDEKVLDKYGWDTICWTVFVKNNIVYVVNSYNIKEQEIACGLSGYESMPEDVVKHLFRDQRIIMRTGRRLLSVEDGYLIGVNKGEFGAVLLWYSKDAKRHYKISDHHLIQFIRRGNKIFAIEGLAHLSVSIGSLIEVAKTNGKWETYTSVSLPAAPVGIAKDSKGNFIVGTSDGLLRIDEYGNRETLVDNAFWDRTGYLYPQNLIVKDDIVYMGMRDGVFKYNLNTKEMEWLMKDLLPHVDAGVRR